jgi:hypothetical protein
VTPEDYSTDNEFADVMSDEKLELAEVAKALDITEKEAKQIQSRNPHPHTYLHCNSNSNSNP